MTTKGGDDDVLTAAEVRTGLADDVASSRSAVGGVRPLVLSYVLPVQKDSENSAPSLQSSL